MAFPEGWPLIMVASLKGYNSVNWCYFNTFIKLFNSTLHFATCFLGHDSAVVCFLDAHLFSRTWLRGCLFPGCSPVFSDMTARLFVSRVLTCFLGHDCAVVCFPDSHLFSRTWLRLFVSRILTCFLGHDCAVDRFLDAGCNVQIIQRQRILKHVALDLGQPRARPAGDGRYGHHILLLLWGHLDRFTLWPKKEQRCQIYITRWRDNDDKQITEIMLGPAYVALAARQN